MASSMSFQQIDALTLAAIAGELSARAVGSRVEDVIAPTPHSLALQLYAPGLRAWLIASAHPQLARVHLAEGKPRKLIAEPPTFVMLLRKYLEGARLGAVRQPRWERLIELGFTRGASTGAATEERRAPEVWLTVEVMGRRSNLILRGNDGIILGALHLVSSDVNAYRAIQPHVAYREPPPQTRQLFGAAVPRLQPEILSADDLREAAREMLAQPAEPADVTRKTRRRPPSQERTVAGLLAGHVAGWNRELAREMEVRALGHIDVPLTLDLPWDELAAQVRTLAALPQTHAWRPTLVRDAETPESAASPPIAFAVFAPQQRHADRLIPMPSANALLATYFEGSEWRATIEGAKSDLRHLLRVARERCVRKEQALRQDLAALDEAARLREEADILLAFQSAAPAHAASVTLPNPFAGEDQPDATVTLTLDPRFSAVENANRRYARYHKLQRATGHIPGQIAANALELLRVEQLATDLDLAETSDEIAHVRRELVEAGYLREKPDARMLRKPSMQGKGSGKGRTKGGKGAKPGAGQRKAEGGTPLRRQIADGFIALVGKNSRQNEEVTFHQAASNDLWLHARGVPGAHIIIKSGGRPVSEAALGEAAALAAYYSQSRAAGTVPVDVTEQRYVRHMKGGGPGMVIYERERTLYAAPADVAAS